MKFKAFDGFSPSGLLFAAIQCFEVPNWETDPFLGLGSIIMVITHSSLFLETQATTPLVITHIVSFSRNSPTLSESAYISKTSTLLYADTADPIF